MAITNPQLVIRCARKSDRDQTIKISEQSFGRLYHFFAIRSLRSEKRIMVAEFRGRIVAFIILRTITMGKKRIGYIFWIAVHPESRRKGIAKELIRATIARFQNERADVVYASIEGDNIASRRLFTDEGFSEITRKDLRKEYGLKTILLYFKLFIAPHEQIFSKKLN